MSSICKISGVKHKNPGHQIHVKVRTSRLWCSGTLQRMRVNIVPTLWNHWKRNAQSLDICLKRALPHGSQSQWLGNRSLSQKDWTLGSVASSYSLEVVADLQLCLHWFRCCKVYNFKHFYMYLVPWFFVFNTWDFTNGTGLQSQVKQGCPPGSSHTNQSARWIGAPFW